jgi:PEP-CTERM motif
VPVHATLLTFGLDTEFSGGTAPASGLTPWLTATFDDSYGSNKQVKLTLEATHLTGTEFVSNWDFNFNPALVLTQLSITAINVSDSSPIAVTKALNSVSADGGGYYDINFNFPTNSGNRLTNGESVTYQLEYTNPITVDAFNFLSAPHGDHGTYYSAAHVQSIGANGNGSGWIAPTGTPGDPPGTGDTVPEPATMILMGMGMFGIGFGIRRKTK